jgi:valyl-tRNA synthetase
VRDKMGRKMSKSLGNSPEPMELIAKFGGDAVRVGMLLCSPAGNDLLYDEGLIEQGRNFSNKIWNALRLVKGWDVDPGLVQPENNRISLEWFKAVLNSSIENINELFDNFRLSEILMTIYKLVWDDFCSWYLEMIKPAYQQPIDKATYETTIEFFDQIVRLLHPFMPFITEEAWHVLRERGEKETIMYTRMPEEGDFNKELITKFTIAEEVIMAIRNIRKEKNIPFRETIPLFIRKNYGEAPDLTFDPVVIKLCNLSELGYTEDKISEAVSFIVRNTEFYIPLTHSMDKEAEIRKLEEEITYTRGFLEMVMKKLNNKKFTEGAPPSVVEAERRKQADAEGKILVMEAQIKSLKG